jgi:glycosyltransferase involved in cell wall biosynthesis
MTDTRETDPSDSSDQLEPWRKGVTIGIPLFNEAPFIEAAIRSAAPQCETLLVADNCSTDGSVEICNALAAEYSNLVFINHGSNQGATSNFRFVMDRADSPYFMWLGGHDWIPTDYVRLLRRVLDSDPLATLAFGDVAHMSCAGKEVSRYQYFFSDGLAQEHSVDRFLCIVKFLHDCSLIHGLARTASLKSVWEEMNFLGGDHVLLAKLVLAGKFLYVPNTFLFRRDVHATYSPQSQLERITGTTQTRKVVTYERMQNTLYALAVEKFEGQGRLWRYDLLNVRFWLVSRFGPFCEGINGKLIDRVLYQWARLIRAIY